MNLKNLLSPYKDDLYILHTGNEDQGTLWVKVTVVSSGVSKLHFTAGMKKTRKMEEAYNVSIDGITVDKF